MTKIKNVHPTSWTSVREIQKKILANSRTYVGQRHLGKKLDVDQRTFGRQISKIAIFLITKKQYRKAETGFSFTLTN